MARIVAIRIGFIRNEVSVLLPRLLLIRLLAVVTADLALNVIWVEFYRGGLH